MGPFNTNKWFVCHGIGSKVHFVELTAGSILTSGQPNIEEFDDEASGLTRAETLGYTKQPNLSIENSFEG